MWILKVEKADAAGGSGRNSVLFEVFLLNMLNIKSNTSFLGTRIKTQRRSRNTGPAEQTEPLTSDL